MFDLYIETQLAPTLHKGDVVILDNLGGYKPRAIRGAHERWLRDRVARGDFTLHGLVGELADRGLKVDYRSVWTFVHEQGLSYKKNAGGWRASAP